MYVTVIQTHRYKVQHIFFKLRKTNFDFIFSIIRIELLNFGATDEHYSIVHEII